MYETYFVIYEWAYWNRYKVQPNPSFMYNLIQDVRMKRIIFPERVY